MYVWWEVAHGPSYPETFWGWVLLIGICLVPAVFAHGIGKSAARKDSPWPFGLAMVTACVIFWFFTA